MLYELVNHKIIIAVLVVFSLYQFDAKALKLTEKQIKKLNSEFDSAILKAKSITNGRVSLPFSIKALEIAQKLNDDLKIAKSYIEISHDYEKLGDISKALQNVILASEKYEKKGKKEVVGIVYNRIGCLYTIQGNYNIAVTYLEKAIAIHKEISANYSYANDINNLGEIYRRKKEYQSALECFKKAFYIFLTEEDSVKYAYASGNIGLVFAACNKMDSADYYLLIANNYLKEKKDFYPVSIYLIETARIYLSQGNTNNALTKAKEALNVALKENLLEQLRDVNELLTEIYASRLEFQHAYIALKNYGNYKDSLSNSKIVSDMAEIRADFEVSKKESQIKNLEAINTLRNRVNWGLGSAFLLVSFLTFFLVRINKQRKQSNQLLSIQKDELEQKNIIIQSSLLEKETLLKEIHHRVKNNLQIISSLLNLQSQNVKSKKALEAFSESQRRLHSIALVHQKLYQNENLSKINISEYLGDLVDTIHQSFYSETKNIRYELNIAEISLDVDTAVPLGLIVNELVTNSYKYAFNKINEGCIFISLNKNNNNLYNLCVKDNGQGLPGNFDFNASESLGLKLVNILSRQLKGELKMISNPGAEFNLEFEDIIQSKA